MEHIKPLIYGEIGVSENFNLAVNVRLMIGKPRLYNMEQIKPVIHGESGVSVYYI